MHTDEIAMNDIKYEGDRMGINILYLLSIWLGFMVSALRLGEMKIHVITHGNVNNSSVVRSVIHRKLSILIYKYNFLSFYNAGKAPGSSLE